MSDTQSPGTSAGREDVPAECEHDWMAIQANGETRRKYGPYAMGCARCDAQGWYDWRSETVLVAGREEPAFALRRGIPLDDETVSAITNMSLNRVKILRVGGIVQVSENERQQLLVLSKVLEEARSALAAERAAGAVDTARLDWLDDHRGCRIINGSKGVGIHADLACAQLLGWGRNIREAIDDARALAADRETEE